MKFWYFWIILSQKLTTDSMDYHLPLPDISTGVVWWCNRQVSETRQLYMIYIHVTITGKSLTHVRIFAWRINNSEVAKCCGHQAEQFSTGRMAGGDAMWLGR